MPTALPSDAAKHHRLSQDASRAYNVCRDFEELATVNDNVRDIMHARILGYLIIKSPSLTAQGEVVKLIHSCNNNYATLSVLASTFLDYYICPFKKYKGRTPEGSSNSSPPSFEDTSEAMLAEIKDSEVPKTHVVAKQKALIRDGYRCIVTSQYDSSPNSKKKWNVTEEEVIAAGGVCITRCAHIAPDSMYFNENNLSNKVERGYVASVLAVLQQFGYDIKNTNGNKVHSLYNVMTMELNSHILFNCLELWFEETATPNCYKVQKPKNFIRIKDQVTFTTPDPVKFPLPSPHLLALHATCAQVAHLSGAGEYIDFIFEDLEEIHELACDGTSLEVLHHALTTLGPQASSINV
ncbi:hypothetical protein V8E53_002496 [Lactarius tabidus]